MQHDERLGRSLFLLLITRIFALSIFCLLFYALYSGAIVSPWHFPVGFLAIILVFLVFRPVSPSSGSEWGRQLAVKRAQKKAS